VEDDFNQLPESIMQYHKLKFTYEKVRNSAEFSIDLRLTPWSIVLLEKPPVVQLLKNFPTFYGTRNVITMFTRALHWYLY
jgi:hypothetical protein